MKLLMIMLTVMTMSLLRKLWLIVAHIIVIISLLVYKVPSSLAYRHYIFLSTFIWRTLLLHSEQLNINGI